MSLSAFLQQVPELAAVSQTTMRAIAFAFVEAAHAPGARLAVTGAALPSMHVLLEGQVAVEGSRSVRLGPGSIFGLAGVPGRHYRAQGRVRTATLSARALSFLTQAPTDVAAVLRRATSSMARAEAARLSGISSEAVESDRVSVPAASRSAIAPAITAVGGLVATGLASLACVGPFVAALLGIGGMGVLVQTSVLRVPATLATFALLGLGFFLAYRRRACGKASRSLHLTRAGLWIATTIALSLTLFQTLALPHLG